MNNVNDYILCLKDQVIDHAYADLAIIFEEKRK